MRAVVVRVVKAKHVRTGNRIFIGGLEGEELVKPKWREVTEVDYPSYDRHVRLTWGDGLDDWETLDEDERVLVIQ